VKIRGIGSSYGIKRGLGFSGVEEERILVEVVFRDHGFALMEKRSGCCFFISFIFFFVYNNYIIFYKITNL
jgi:hypothetical protein